MTIIKSVPSVLPAPAASPEVSALTSFLEQAEVCREQAREAARLKRFRSALGLFSTAGALCRHVAAHGDEHLRARAGEFAASLAVEVTTYSDLARSSRAAG